MSVERKKKSVAETFSHAVSKVIKEALEAIHKRITAIMKQEVESIKINV